MHRIAPALVFVLLLAACGSDDGDAGTDTTTPSETTATTAPPTSAEETTLPPTTDESSTTSTEETTTTESDPAESTPDELAALCDAYLRSLTPGQIEAGLDELAVILGADAPPGIQDALDVLTAEDGSDIEEFWAARDSLEGYVVPICADRFAAGIVPAESSQAAADGFYAAVVAGDRAAAAALAPADVVASFDWRPYPEAFTSGYNDVDGSFNMQLEPTVTVFCRAAGGVVLTCAFGE